MKSISSDLPAPIQSRGCRIYHLARTASTQALARRLAEAGEPAWTVIRADSQTRGRGRMDRRWSSGPGGLYFSLILRPEAAPADLPPLSLAFAEACARALEKLAGLATAIKPPNDVLALAADGSYRKVCGILLEASGDTKSVHWLAAGIGVNVGNRLPKRLGFASSLAQLTGRGFDLDSVFDAVLGELCQKFGPKVP